MELNIKFIDFMIFLLKLYYNDQNLKLVLAKLQLWLLFIT